MAARGVSEILQRGRLRTLESGVRGGSFHAQADIPKDSLQGAGETPVANSCGAPQPAVARDDAALLALKDRPVEKTQGSAGDVEEQRLLLLQAAPSNASR